MLLRSDFGALPSVKAVGQVDPPTRAAGIADPRQEAFQRSLSSLLGKSVPAQVLARLADGQFLVQVAGTAVRMMLPQGARVGGELALTVMASQPRATFQLTAGDGTALHATTYSPPSAGAAQGQGAAALGQAAALAASAQLKDGALLADDGPGSPAPLLSDTARIISSVLAAAEQAGPAPKALTGSEPLIASAAPPDPAQLAAKLQQTIAQSGLFYESHLAEWAEGSRSMVELMREPQTGKPPTPPTDPATAHFINLQLSSQEQSRVAWLGQLAQDQQMQWEIHKDAPHKDGRGDDGDAAPAWRSGMRFRLPGLGQIDATVVMSGGQFQVALQAGSSDIGGVLRQHADQLSAAMEAAGTPLSSLSIGVAQAEPGNG